MRKIYIVLTICMIMLLMACTDQKDSLRIDDRVDEIVYYCPDETIVTINDEKKIQEIITLINSAEIETLENKEDIYGWYRMEFVTNDGNITFAFTGNRVLYNGKMYQVKNGVDMTKLLDYFSQK